MKTLLVLLTLLLGVGWANNPTEPLPAPFAPVTPIEVSLVRVAHLSRDAPAVEVSLVGEATEVVSLDYGQVTDYLHLPPGAYDVAVSSEDGALLVQEGIFLDAGLSYTAAVLGIAGHAQEGVEPLSLRLETYHDRFPLFPETASGLRVIHAFPAGVTIEPVVRDTVRDTGEVLRFPALGFAEANEYQALEPGDYSLEILAADTGELLLAVQNVPLEAGSFHTLFVTGGVEAEAVLTTEGPLREQE